MNYGNWTGHNLQSTDADGIISPNILLIVHKAINNSIYSSHSSYSRTFYVSRKVVPFLGKVRIQLYYAAAPKPGTLKLGSQSSYKQNDAAELSHGV